MLWTFLHAAVFPTANWDVLSGWILHLRQHQDSLLVEVWASPLTSSPCSQNQLGVIFGFLTTLPSLARNKLLSCFFLSFFSCPPSFKCVFLLCGYLKATTWSHTHVPVRKKQKVPGSIPRKNHFPGILRRLPLLTEAEAISQGQSLLSRVQSKYLEEPQLWPGSTHHLHLSTASGDQGEKLAVSALFSTYKTGLETSLTSCLNFRETVDKPF